MDLFRRSSLGRFQSLFSGFQQSSPIESEKCESAPAAPSGRNHDALQNQQESAGAARVSWNTTSSLARSNARTPSRCLWGYIYILSKHHTPSQVSAPAKHQMISQKTASRKKQRDKAEFPKQPEMSTSSNHKINYYFIAIILPPL